MDPIRAIGRAARVLAGLAATVLAFAAAMPATLASTPPGRPRLLSWADPPLPPDWNKHPPPGGTHPALRYPPGWNKHPPLPAHAHALATGGMSGWQIALIAAAATILAAAMLGAWAGRHKPATVAASAGQASSRPTPAPAPPVR